MKLAIVHDWFVRVGGAERVLMAMHALWPEAPIYFLVADRTAVRAHLPGADVRLARLGHLPFAAQFYPALGWAMPAAVESLDLSGYDTVLSSSAMFAKGAVVRPGTRHISYCYSPSRMLWDRAAAYERRGILSAAARHALRSWDQAAAQRPDELVAISRTVADRIGKYWRRNAVVLPPPVMPARDAVPQESRPYFLAVARLVPHKGLDVLVDAFNKIRQPLIIVGDGPLRRALARRAGPTVRIAGWQSDDALAALYAGATAVVVPNEEDFGLTAVEAMTYGKPVLALRAGGVTETVLEGVTGEFFDDPIPEAVADGVRRIRGALPSYDAAGIRRHAEHWSQERWSVRMRTLVESV